MNAIKRCIPHYTLNVPEQKLSNGHNVIKLQTETSNINKPAFMKNVNHYSERSYEVSVGNTNDTPIYVSEVFY